MHVGSFVPGRRGSQLKRCGLAAAVILLLSGCAAPAGPSLAATADPPAAPPMSRESREALLTADAAEARESLLGRFPDTSLPAVSLVRAVAPSEWASTIATCMTVEGFASNVEGNAVSTTPFPAAQEEAHAIATYTCRVSYPIDPVYRQPYGTEEIDYLYGYLTTDLTSCLAAAGYTTEAPPSRGTFADGLSNGFEWSPFDTVRVTGDRAFAELLQICPPKPAGFRGY